MKLNINLKKANDCINQGLYSDAIKLCDKELNLNPKNSTAWLIKGLANLKLNNYEDSIICNDRALKEDNSLQVAWLNKGVAYKQIWKLKESIFAYKKAIEINPKLNIMWINLARVYETMGNYVESEKCYKYILNNIDRSDSLAKYNLSLLSLKKGNLKEGFKNFEFRFDNSIYQKRRFIQIPLLRKLNKIKNKKILVWMEGGLGDAILFCRYLDELLKLGAQVTCEVQPQLIEIIKTLNPKIHYVLYKSKKLDNLTFDFQIPLMSLPFIFQTDLKNIPKKSQYLKVDQKLNNYWRLELKKYSKPKIGLIWSSSSSAQSAQYRSIDINNLLPIIYKKYNYFSIQKTISDKENIFFEENNIINFGQHNLNNIFAIINNLDLIISIDTLFVQMAGLLNIPTWVMLNLASDWKWIKNREDFPWYSSVRVFSQKEYNNWSHVIKKIQKELTYFFK